MDEAAGIVVLVLKMSTSCAEQREPKISEMADGVVSALTVRSHVL
jgi:hypothetical protein